VLQYKCDWCGRARKRGEAWKLGLAGEHSGVTGNRRQVEMLKRWNAQWAAHPLAVHFCSDKHRQSFVDALFSAPWPAVDKSAVARAAFQRRKSKPAREKMSDAVTERHIADKDPNQKNAKAAKPRRKRKPRKLPSLAFSESDLLYARGLGIQLDPPAESGPSAPAEETE
jgi:hypothetical protein